MSCFFSWETFSWNFSPVTYSAVLTTLSHLLRRVSKKFHRISSCKKNNVFQKTFLHGMFHLTQKMQFWQSCRERFAVNPKYYGLQSEKQSKMFFFQGKVFPWRQSCGNVEFSSDSTANKNRRKFPEKRNP